MPPVLGSPRFRPYGSIKEVFRDLPWLFHGAMSFLWFMLKPFHQFSNQAGRKKCSMEMIGNGGPPFVKIVEFHKKVRWLTTEGLVIFGGVRVGANRVWVGWM